MEKVLQGPSRSEEVYTLPFTKENLKELYDRRQNELINFVVKDEQTGKPFQVKDVNSQKTFSCSKNHLNICLMQNIFLQKSNKN
jgi:hypothetical protein